MPQGGAAWWVLAESGGSSVVSLGLETNAFTNPRIINTFEKVGANPTSVAHPCAYVQVPCIDWIGPIWQCSTNPGCWYNGTEQQLVFPDAGPAQDLYICARGASQVSVVNMVSGLRSFYSPISIPGIRDIATPASQ